MIVLDAGAWVTALIADGPAGDYCRERLSRDTQWIGPAHLPYEAMRTIERYRHSAQPDPKLTQAAFSAIISSNVLYFGPEPWLLDETWALRQNLGIYDAPYAALARRFNATLLTCDKRLAHACAALGLSTLVPRAGNGA